ncbi:MAG: precorrin-6y C5,15-methyltransferase (decarboxylating) subunit CbiE [Solirubrobacteraceae bacterium]
MTITVVGIGADGWDGLGETAKRSLIAAPLVVGSERQLALLPATVPGDRRTWPSPIEPLVDELAAGARGDVAVLASGNPMLHGIGATLARRAGAERLHVIPAASAFALACARLGWAQADVEVISAVARPPEALARALQPGRRIVAYVTGSDGAARIARVLCERGFGASPFTVLEQLGGPREQRLDTTAAQAKGHVADPLHVVAIAVQGGPGHPRTPGLPDEAFASDGQLTKRHVRAMTIAALTPLPGQLLWDVGAGSGSIAVEWLRAESSVRAIAIEGREDRAARIERNALALGVPELGVVVGRAPDVLHALAAPDAIFIGGGITTPGLLERCWAALKGGGRLVANTVTLEGERALVDARLAHGGGLTRIDVAQADPVGTFTAWRAQMTVVQWSATKVP